MLMVGSPAAFIGQSRFHDAGLMELILIPGSSFDARRRCIFGG